MSSLGLKSCRANKRSKMFVDGRLSDSFNLDGTRAESTLARQAPGSPGAIDSASVRTLTADERLELEILKHNSRRESSGSRQLIATTVPELENDPEPEVRVQGTQTLTQAELCNGLGVGFLEFLTLFGNMELDAYAHFHRQFAMRLFCPLVQDKDLPACVNPEALRSAGYDSTGSNADHARPGQNGEARDGRVLSEVRARFAFWQAGWEHPHRMGRLGSPRTSAVGTSSLP